MRLNTVINGLTRITCLVACALVLLPSVMAAADDPPLTGNDVYSLTNNTPFYDPTACATDPSSTDTSSTTPATPTPSGTLNEDVGASDFTDAGGYKGDSLAGTYSYGELSPTGFSGTVTDQVATDLGGLPYKQKLAITYKGKTVVAEKLDIGKGGDPVNGKQRAIDLHVDKTAQALGFSGTDVVHVQTVADTTPLGPLSGSLPGSSTPAASTDTSATGCCDAANSASVSSNSPPVAGDLKSLAQQILANKSITFDYGPNGEVAKNFQLIAAGQKALTQNNNPVDVEPIVLVTILHLAQGHKVNVSSLTDGIQHIAPTNPHGSGKAADINILDGSHTTGTDSVADKITAAAAEVLPNKARFGLGNNGGVAVGSKQIGGKTFITFQDDPSHVHFDVKDVSQADDDAAVQAAGAGISSGQSSASCCPSSTNTSPTSVTGSISPGVGKGMTPSAQQKFQQILVAASQKFGTDPNFIAAFYYAENAPTGDSTNNGDSSRAPPQTGNGKWREPAPPYGVGSPYPAPNQFSATGPFQFINSTWAQYGVDGNGDGRKDVNDLTDAAFAAAKYMAAAGGKKGASDSALKTAANVYNHSDTYAQSVLNTFHYLTGTGQTTVSGSSPGSGGSAGCSGGASTGSGNYQNPFRDVPNIAQAGIDAGVDYSGDGPVHPIGDGTILAISGHSGWVGGNAVKYQVKGGTADKKVIYVAENCTVNNALKVGQTVSSNDVLCTMHNSYPYIETGWANDKPGGATPLAYDDKCYYITNPAIPSKTSTAYGTNFDSLMQKLGAPKASLLGGSVTCALPSGWPTAW